jgi:ureidoacrylate peracid hydrolase
MGGPTAPHYLKHVRMRVGDTVTAPDGSASRILVQDTWNTEIVDALKPHPGDLVVGKTRYSGFFGTGLAGRLLDMGIRTLVFVGTTTSICVESTVRDATFRDFTPVVLRDCTAEPIAFDAPRSNHEASLLAIELLFGWTSDSGAFCKALSGETAAAA